MSDNDIIIKLNGKEIITKFNTARDLLVNWMLWLEGCSDLDTINAVTRFIEDHKEEEYNPSRKYVELKEAN